ncbi:MAG TPA: 50S ribosome-binding protein YggL [Gemmatimonadaceae bacterium]|nr:50S ribosome-binding protein YggL [Gemmatimonadaceae bacterium]
MSAPCPRFGFDVRLRAAPGLSAAASDALARAFAATVEARGLSASARRGEAWCHVVTRDGGQAVDADREALAEWAASRPDLAGAMVGPLVDLGANA